MARGPQLAGRLAGAAGRGAAGHQARGQHAPVAGAERSRAGWLRRRGGQHAVGRAPRPAARPARADGGQWPASATAGDAVMAWPRPASSASSVPRSGTGAARTSRPAGGRRRPARGEEEFVSVPAGLVRRSCARPGSRSRTGPPNGAAGCPPPQQVVLYSGACRPRCAPARARVRRDPPRRVDAARGGHATSSASGTSRPSSTARSGCRASPSPRRGPTWPACARPRAEEGDATSSTGRSCGPAAPCTPTGACCSPAPTRKRRSGAGISYFLLDMRTPGIDVRPIRQTRSASPTSARSSSPTWDPGQPAHRRRRTAAGRWRRRRSAPSGA